MIEIKDLYFSYGEKAVIKNLNLKFPSSGTYAIMGPSGCGKTTLLYLIAGLLKPSGGSIELDRDKIAYSFQEPRLLEQMTALENVKFVLKGKDARAKAQKSLKALGLEDEMDYFPRSLSGGMKQRVSIARALAYDGDVTLLDEPFNGLDEEIKGQAAALLREKAQGSLVIIITHSTEDAMLCGAKILNFEELNK